MNGEPHSVCYDNGFDNIAASLICRHVGLSSRGYAMRLPHNLNFSIAFTDVHCNSSAVVPYDCVSRSYNASVDTCSGDAGVKCQGMDRSNEVLYYMYFSLVYNF